MARVGADVTVWTLGREHDDGFFRPVDPRVQVEVVPFPPVDDEGVGPRILRSIATLRQAFRAEGYDIVHAQDCITANAVGTCVRTIHHLDHFTTPELAACHERAIVTPYAHVCVSAAVAAEVRQGWGLDPTVIANGVDAARFAAAAASGAGAEWSDRLGRYVLAVGGVEPRKGSIDLLEAYALLRQQMGDLQLVFAGGETLFDYRHYRADFDARADALGVEPHFLGVLDHDQLPGLVAGSATFSFVSTREGFGLAAMEALAARVPVVARDLPVLREVFGDHVRYGRTVPEIAQALAKSITDGPLPGGAAFAATHSWDTAALSHLAFYADLSDAQHVHAC